jgi:5-methylthioadenosine/S-adenosylhomocysteine deaminase
MGDVSMAGAGATLIITGGRVYDPTGDVHLPSVKDIVIEGSTIASVSRPEEDAPLKSMLRDAAKRHDGPTIIDAGGKLVMPGFVNAHYHSYDVLAKGMLEDMPFDVWALHSQPAYFGKRSKAELRARTLLGALDCLLHGVTTVQDMNTLVPQDEETLDTIRAAYEEIGIRVVFSIAMRDVAALDIAPFLPAGIAPETMALIAGSPRDPKAEIDFVERQIKRLGVLPPRFYWALSPSGPQRSSRTLLEGVADLARRYRLPILTHVYETKAQTAKARAIYPEHGGSMIRFMADVGLLDHRIHLAHGVWLLPDEVALLAGHDAGVVHNPMSNLKLKSGIAPMAAIRDAGLNVALGCDNCSCGDCQNMFQAMKLYCLLAAVNDPQPTGVHARDAIHAATLGGARAIGLEDVVGAVQPGLKADLILIDLADIAFQPLNSVARQLVFSETGRGVATVIVDGRVVVTGGRIKTIDMDGFRAELNEVMDSFRRDFATIARKNQPAITPLLAANGALMNVSVGLDRFGPRFGAPQ